MLIYIRSNTLKSFTINVSEKTKIIEIKETIQKTNNFPKEKIILVYDSKKLDDNKLIDEYNICENSVIELGVIPN